MMNDADHNIDRRGFLGTAGSAAAAIAAAQFGMADCANAEVITPKRAAQPEIKAGRTATFGPVKQINAGVLSVGYVEAGPEHGQPVILMHGWPYDIHSYVEVAPLLGAAGYRAIVPYFRGHGSTRFLSRSTPRSAAQSAFALDIIALMDALKIERAILAGYDWGSRTADIIAALWPARCKALVSATGYLITNRTANRLPLPPEAEWDWWYQYYFATDRGRLGLKEYRHDLAKLVWKFNSPTWHFSAATFNRSATAFTNSDYVSIVIGNYRWRLDLVKTDPRYGALEQRLAKAPRIRVPTITLDGAHDPFTPAGKGAAYRKHFIGRYTHRTLNVGHNLPQEAPHAFAEAVVEANGL